MYESCRGCNYLNTRACNKGVSREEAKFSEACALYKYDEEVGVDVASSNCSTCKHLLVVNEGVVYAYCVKNKWTFELFEVDTRKTVCNGYREVQHES